MQSRLCLSVCLSACRSLNLQSLSSFSFEWRSPMLLLLLSPSPQQHTGLLAASDTMALFVCVCVVGGKWKLAAAVVLLIRWQQQQQQQKKRLMKVHHHSKWIASASSDRGEWSAVSAVSAVHQWSPNVDAKKTVMPRNQSDSAIYYYNYFSCPRWCLYARKPALKTSRCLLLADQLFRAEEDRCLNLSACLLVRCLLMQHETCHMGAGTKMCRGEILVGGHSLLVNTVGMCALAKN